MHWIYYLAIALVTLFAAYHLFHAYLTWKYTSLPFNYPTTFDRETLRRPAGGVKKIAVYAGDSLTHATLGYDWVSGLRESDKNDEFAHINAGINGHTSWNLL